MRVLRLTTRETAKAIQRQFGGELTPDWRMRRVVDSLEERDALEVQRCGQARTIADVDIGIVAEELRRLGVLKSEALTC